MTGKKRGLRKTSRIVRTPATRFAHLQKKRKQAAVRDTSKANRAK